MGFLFKPFPDSWSHFPCLHPQKSWWFLFPYTLRDKSLWHFLYGYLVFLSNFACIYSSPLMFLKQNPELWISYRLSHLTVSNKDLMYTKANTVQATVKTSDLYVKSSNSRRWWMTTWSSKWTGVQVYAPIC